MNFLTPQQYKYLEHAWKTKGFTVAEAYESGMFGDVAADTIRTNVKRVTDKGFLKEIKEKGKSPRYVPAISKQVFYINLARIWFGDAPEEDKAFFRWAMDQV